MADLTISISIKDDTREGSNRVKSEIRGIGEESEKSARRAQSLAKIDYSGAIKQLKEYGDKIRNFGNTLSSLGQKGTLFLTAPIVAATYALGKYGLNIEAVKNQFTAFEGSSQKAEMRLNSLRSMVDRTAGATREMAYDVYGLLKPLKASDERIDQTIATIGRLKLGFKNLNPSDFSFNLAQIFGQGFELSDIKQAIGQVPKFREYLVKAFGTDDGETLKKMKESGKLTFDGFLKGFAEAVQGDSALSGLKEPVALRMQKFFERAFEAVEPVANKIVDILEYVLNTAEPYIAKFAEWFNSLSPYAQKLVIVFAAIAAAVSPVITVLGSLISFFAPIVVWLGSLGLSISAAGGLFAFLGTTLAAVGTFITGTLLPALAGLLPIIAAVVVGVGTLVAAGAILYASWVNDFGGFKTYTLQVWEAVKSAFQTSMTYIYSIVQTVGGAVVAWWRQNYPLIKQIVVSVSDSIKNTIGAFLETVKQFWQNHGAAIISYVQTYWNLIKTTISQAVTLIGNIIRFGLQLINGKWADAWQTFLKIIQNAAKLWATVLKAGIDLAVKFLYAAIPIILEFGVKAHKTITEWIGKAIVGAVYIIATLPQRIAAIIPKLIASGVSIVQAIWEGIKQGWRGSSETPLAIELSANNTFDPKQIDYSRPQNTVLTPQQPVASLDTTKLTQDADKLKQAREELAKNELSAQIALYANHLDEVSRMYDKAFAEISDVFKKTGDSDGFRASFEKLKLWYNQTMDDLAPAYDKLVQKQTLSEVTGQNQRELAFQQHQQKLKGYLDNFNDSQKQAQELLTEHTKKQTDEQLKLSTDAAKKFQDAQNQIVNSGLNDRFGIAEQVKLLDEQISKKRELSAVEQQRIKDAVEITKAETEWRNAGFSDVEIQKLRTILLGQQEETLKRIATLEGSKEKAATAKAYSDLYSDLSNEAAKLKEQLDGLNDKTRTSTELSKADAIAKLLQSKEYANLSDEQRKNLQIKAQEVDQYKEQVKAAEDAKKQFEKTANELVGSLLRIFQAGVHGGFKGFLSQLLTELKNFGEKLLDDILGELSKRLSNFLLKKFFGGENGSSSGGGFSLGGIFNSIKKLFNFGGSSPSGTSSSNSSGGFNFGGSGGALGGAFNIGSLGSSGGLHADPLTNYGQFGVPSGGRGGAGSGIGLAGGIALGGMAANIVGGLIGGRLGSFISGVGSGAAMGATLGSIVPGLGTLVGAGIGAVAGGLLSLLGGDPKRKRDKKEKLPALNKVFADALSQLRALGADKNSFYENPEAAIAKAVELRGVIASGGGVSFESKKYQKISQQQIAQKLAEADGIIAELNKLKDRAVRARDVDSLLQTSFAGGVYMDSPFMNQFGDFKRRNGFLTGGIAGKDSLPSLLMPREIVLNEAQQQRIRLAAGHDIFEGKGIPHYASGTYVAPYATGAYLPPTSPAPSSSSVASPSSAQNNQSMTLTLCLKGDEETLRRVEFEDALIDGLKSDKVQVQLVKSTDKGRLRNG